jgi:hypothetical protein
VSEYTIKPLSTETWDAFARLCEKHNGEFLVREGRSHAALVFDGDVAIGSRGPWT